MTVHVLVLQMTLKPPLQLKLKLEPLDLDLKCDLTFRSKCR